MTLKELVNTTALPLRNGQMGFLPLPYRVAIAICCKWAEETAHLMDPRPFYGEASQLDAQLPTGAVLTRIKKGAKHRWGLKLYAYDSSDATRTLEQLV
jgi:hypothetical protein